MLGVTLLLSAATFSARKVTAVHGAAHLIAFAAYGIILFSLLASAIIRSVRKVHAGEVRERPPRGGDVGEQGS